MTDDSGRLIDVDAEALALIVQRLLGAPAAVIEDDWSCRPLGGGGGEGLGLYKITGSARVKSGHTHWELVVKVCAGADGADPRAWDYPAREGLAYGSGLLEGLPGGLAVARCLDFEVQPEGTTRLWLECVVDQRPGPWPLDHYTLVARQLGRFNGAYLVGTPLPDKPWLSDGWHRGFVEQSAAQFSALTQQSAYVDSDAVQRLYPPPVVVELQRLWDERAAFLTILDRLPRTLCHFDAFRRNWLSRATPDGEELILLDWPYVGPGAPGEELVALVIGSLLFFEADGIDPSELDSACFSAYVMGLREAGWDGDEQLVRLGFTASAALRYTLGLIHLSLPGLADPSNYPGWELLFRRPLGTVLDNCVDLWPFQWALADEARSLAHAAGLWD